MQTSEKSSVSVNAKFGRTSSTNTQMKKLDKCFDEMFPIMKLVHEKHAVEFHIPDKEYSPEERDALAHQIAYEVRNQSMAQIRKVIAALKAWQGGK